jgi:hypothetical protein
MQTTAHKVGQAVGDDTGIATARLELGEDGEAGRRVGVEDGAGEALDAVCAREAEELLNVGRPEWIDP